MDDDEILVASLMEDFGLSLSQVAAACRVEPAWLIGHIEAGRLPQAEYMAGDWRFSSTGLLRARRMRQLERDFDAVPELAALMADLMEEMDALRARLRSVGLE